MHPGPHPVQGYGVIGQEDVLVKQPVACDLNPVAVTGVAGGGDWQTRGIVEMRVTGVVGEAGRGLHAAG